jgi:regulator of sirC expression with transglutaminase-like and TPR domain
LTLKAQILIKKEDPNEALKVINLSLELDPTSFEAIATRAHVALNQYTEAVEQFRVIPKDTFEGEQYVMLQMGREWLCWMQF